MTPNELEILMHYYISPKPHPRIDAPACQETTQKFMDDGIFEFNGGDSYLVTEKGQAWIRMILKTPYPIPAYIDHKGKEV